MIRQVKDVHRKEVGRLLQELRHGMGLTQQQVADVLGVNRSAVASYETGQYLPSIPSFRILARLYETPLETLIAPLPEGGDIK